MDEERWSLVRASASALGLGIEFHTFYCAFTPQAARASKWPELIHFQCEPAASSGESVAARTVRASRRVEIKSALW